MGFIDQLLNGDYMPHGHCFLWRDDLLYMHVGGDLATALAYFIIPLALVQLVRHRSDLAFNWIFLMFALFIFFCGVTHIIDAVNVWQGYYHVEGIAKVSTAAVSLATAALVWRLLPAALAFPSHQDLLAKNKELSALQAGLESANHELERKVEERTAELQALASTDSLTGLSNRRALMDTLDRELARAQRYGHELSVVMLDIDDFKALNDLYGHQAGDATLQAMAEAFREECRSSDMVGRHGGEEFVVLMPQAGIEEARQFAERLLERVRTTIISSNGDELSVTCSIGVAPASAANNMGELIHLADQAMYEAKSMGKNRVVLAPQADPS